MRQKRRRLQLSRETLRYLNGDLSSVAGGTGTVIDTIVKTVKTECPSCKLTCKETCSIDPPSACLPDGCSVRCDG